MLRIDRYIVREVLVPALIAVATLTFIFFSTRNGALLEIIIRQLATPAELWLVSAALLPSVFTVTLPMGLLVGVLTGFGRMSSDSEAIALRASGVSMLRLLRPVALVAAVFAAVTLGLTVWVAPLSLARFNSMKERLAAKYISLELQPRVFNEKLPGHVLFVTEIAADNGLHFRKMMVAANGNAERPTPTFAESGTLIPHEAERRWELRLVNASTLEVSPESPAKDRISTLKEVRSTVEMQQLRGGNERAAAELPTQELWQRMRAGTATRLERIAFHERLALPFACVALALIGFPLGVSTSRGGKSVGLVLSLVLMVVYYLAFMGGTRLAGENTLPPVLGAWIPNIAFLALGLVLLTRSDREYQNRILTFVGDAIDSLARKVGTLRLRGLNVSPWRRSPRHHPKYFRLLDVYVLRGFLFYLGIVLSVFTSLFVVVTLFEQLPYIVRYNIPTRTVALYYAYFLPQILYFVVPLAVLLAVLITLGALTKTNEVLAVKAGAVSLYRLSLPLVLMAALVSGIIYVVQDFVLPYTNKRQDEYNDIIRGRQPQTYSDRGRKWMKGTDDGTFVRIYYYELFDNSANVFGNLSVFLIDPATFALREWTFAKRAAWTNGVWSFEQGWTRRDSPVQSLTYSAFETSERSMDEPEYFKKEVREADQMNYMELHRYVAEFRESGFDVTRLTIDLYRKLAFPMVSFIMAIIEFPFSFKTGRKGAFYGIGLCVAVGISYWSMIELFDKLGGIHRLEPFVAAWFPNFIFGAGGLWMFLRVRT